MSSSEASFASPLDRITYFFVGFNKRNQRRLLLVAVVCLLVIVHVLRRGDDTPLSSIGRAHVTREAPKGQMASWQHASPCSAPLEYCEHAMQRAYFRDSDSDPHARVRDVVRQRCAWQTHGVNRMLYDLLGEGKMPIANHSTFSFLGPTFSSLCAGGLHSFAQGDEEKRACGLQAAEARESEQCVVVSIGSENRWEFESAVFDETDCIVHTLDCTCTEKPCTWAVPERLRSRVTLHDVCIASHTYTDTKGRRFLSYGDVLRHLSLDAHTAVTMLKADIEGYEWPLLPAMLEQQHGAGGFALPDQIAIELHLETWPLIARDLQWGTLPEEKDSESPKFGGYQRDHMMVHQFMSTMFEHGGYVLIDRRDNTYCQHCTEIVLARAVCSTHVSGDADISSGFDVPKEEKKGLFEKLFS